MSDYPIEALLRPPVELCAALTYVAIAALLLLAPELFLMLPAVASLTAGLLALRAAVRFHQGLRIHRYLRHLWRLPRYTLSSRKVPVSRRKLFVGRGFTWDQRHTQRLADIERKPGYREPPWLYRWARRFEVRHEHTPWLKALAFAISLDSAANPLRPLPPIGGNPAIHAVGLFEGEQPIVMDLSERVGHALVIGTTRVGKTRFAEILLTQDIRRVSAAGVEDVVIFFDPKGDPDLFRRMYSEAQAAGRLDQLYFFHLGYPELSARYNPVGHFTRITEIASRTAGQLPGEGQSQAFREFVWRYVNVITKALVALGQKPDYTVIKRYGEDIEPLFIHYLEHCLAGLNTGPDGQWQKTVARYERGFKNRDDGFYKGKLGDRSDRAMALYRYYRELDQFDDVAHSLVKTFEYERGYLEKLVGSLLPLMEKLCSGKSAELLSPDYLDPEDQRPIFDWREIIRTGGIVYVGLDALSDPEVASVVGNSMFADLTAVSGLIYKQGGGNRFVDLHADEVAELMGDEFVPLVNKAGGAGFRVTAYTQTGSDIIARLGDTAKAGQVVGNFNTTFMLRVKELATAELITQQLKQVEIVQATLLSGTVDSTNLDGDVVYTSNTQGRTTTQRVDQIHAADLIQLPKGHCFALLNGGIPHKLRLPLPDPRDLEALPNDLSVVVDDMAARYTTSNDWYRFQPSFYREAA